MKHELESRFPGEVSVTSDIQVDLEKAELEVKHLSDHGKSKRIKKERKNKKKPTSSLTMLKPLTVWITTNCGKFLKRWEHQITLPVS